MNEATIIAYLKSECSSREREKLDHWLRESAENRKYFEEIKRIWELSRSDDSGKAASPETSWSRISAAINKDQVRIRPGRNSFMGRYWKVAASVALILGLGFMALRYSGHKASEAEFAVVETLDDKTQVELPDGSQVWLNAHSILSYPSRFGTKERRVRLEGEAFFEVSKEKRRDFTVEISHSRVSVLGTSFNILSPGEEKEQIVTVETGKVSFHPLEDPSGGVQLKAGERGVFSPHNNQYSKGLNEDPNFQAWKTGILKFQGTSLEKVCQAISVHYKRDISLSDSVDKERQLTATWNNKEWEEVVKILTMTLDLSYRIDGEKIIIY